MNNKKFYDSADSYHVSLQAPSTLTANRNIAFPNAAGTLSLVTGTETLTNKTLTSPALTTPIIDGVTYSALNERQIIVDTYTLGGAAIHAANLAIWSAPAAAIILRLIVNITTASTGASTLDFGYTAVSATTSSDTLLDGISGTPAKLFDSADASLDSQANTLAQLAASGKWITVDEASGDATGLVGVAYIFYMLV
jgi:hypothetical protein